MANDDNIVNMNVQLGQQSVSYYYKQGKLTQDQFNKVSNIIKTLFKAISDSQRNYNSLAETKRILHKQRQSIKLEHQSIDAKQDQATKNSEKLSKTLKSAEIAYQSQKASYQNLVFEAEELEKQVQNRLQKMKDDFRAAEQKMQPKIQRFNLEISQTKISNERTKASIENLQRSLEDNMQKINAIKIKNEQLLTEEDKLNQMKLKIKDSPDHYAKSAQNLNIEIIGMNNELKEIKDEIERKQKLCAAYDQKKENQRENITKLIKIKEEDFLEYESIETQIERIKNTTNSLQVDKGQLKVDIMDTEQNAENLSRNIKFESERVNKAKKEVQKIKRQYKKEELIEKQQKQIILQTEMLIEKLKKEQNLIHGEIRGQEIKEKTFQQNIILIADKTQNVKMKVQDNEAKKKSIEIDIEKEENHLTDLKKIVSNIMKEIKDSTAVRESMARKASVAASEVRETGQELKVKGLLILDLEKKYTQTQNKLQHFKALYQEVKSARNKYVNLIQNSSQDLAELKERIKILQNQLQILKNESSEKKKTIQDYNHMKQLQIHKRDQTKGKLNKYDHIKKEKKELVDQNINEIQKQNMIILSLQKDMESLRVKYQEACENRNYTGIQLIDRNDELCILYEKSNIQENILRKSQVAVKGLEDEIRMIKIEISEMERKVKVAQEKLSHVPNLANQVLSIESQIHQAHLRENQLSKELEDPENHDRWRQLGGQDPDQQALDVKISILEERLNSKKQQLLQKELILDEVTNLADKLKTDAEEGRQSTLQVSEKINQFQSRLRDLTRKMKATISELSMCQANIIKYQSERQDLELSTATARKRWEDGLPPTPETEIEYLKLVRDKKRYEEEKRIRVQKELMEQNYPPFATKTTAQQRVNSYIPDEIGLPKPYGINAPFMYQQPGSNMRHFKKPKIKQIEI